MRLVNVRETTVPIRAEMANAFISFAKMDVSVLALITDVIRDGGPVVGYGFNSNGRYAQEGLLKSRIIPRLKEAREKDLIDPTTGLLHPSRIWEVAMRDEKPGGHGERAVAVGIVDMAAWDLYAKLQGQSLHDVLAMEISGLRPAERVWVYAAGGYYYADRGIEALRDEMLSYLDLGYRSVKMKIGGVPLREDLCRIEAVLEALPAGCSLAVDANGRFDLPAAIAYAEALSGYNLMWYEEPTDPLDYAAMAEVASAYEGPLATGENLLSFQDARNLLRFGGLRRDRDILQMDPALSYGLTEFVRTLGAMDQEGWSAERSVPHGGHQFNLGIASAFHLGGCESYPGIFEPFGGFADDIPVQDGFVRLPDAPGIGLELKSGLRPILSELTA